MADDGFPADGELGFLSGGGEIGRLIAAYDWSSTGIGPIGTWPENLKTIVGQILETPVPMVAMWGADGVLIYNAGYAEVCGARHPAALGGQMLEIWPEAADFNRTVLRAVLAGQPLTFRDQELLLFRNGQPERVWMNLHYTPVRGADGTPVGIVAIVSDTTGRVLLERRLATERERFAELFEQAPTFMALLRGPEHRFELANPGYIKLVGRPVVGLTVAEALPEAVAQGYGERLDMVFRTGRAFSAAAARYAVQTAPDAPVDERFLDFVYQPIRDAQGAVTGIFVEGVDVTARIVAERRREALARLTDRFADLDDPKEIGFAAAEILGETLKVNRVGYGTVDPAAEILQIDRAWAAAGTDTILGVIRLRDYGSFVEWMKRGELIAISDVRSDPRTAEAVKTLIETKVHAFVVVPIVEQGRLVAEIYVNSAEIRDWSAEDIALIREVAARTRTVVERARTTRALRDREAQLLDANRTLEWRVTQALAERKLLADLVENSDTFVQVLDNDYRFLAINRANVAEYLRIYGVRPAVGDSLRDILADRPALQHAALAIWTRALAGEAFTEVAEFGDPAVETRWYEMQVRPLYGTDGARIGAYQFSNDVTERRREQARLAEAEEQLRQSQKMEAVGQLTGGLAHDFNNLLAAISGGLELLEKRLAEGRLGGIERYIAIAQSAARRAAALTQRLLAFSRRQTLDPKVTDLNRLVAGMEELIRRSVGPNIIVEVVGAGGLWSTRIDHSQLENSLLNLCINARDAMAPDGGRLTIETANKWLDERAAQDRELPPGQYVSLCVTDTGTGMSPEVVGRAFDPFFTTKPLGEGTGLGLSMVHGFVRQSGGQVRIYSELGKGTTMCLYLPRHVGDVEDADGDALAAVDPGAGEIVLVIDDEASMRALMVEVLEENGYSAIEAGDGPAGLRLLQSDMRIDLMVTDVGLPGGLNGRQVADAARITRPDLKVLFVTGFAENAAVGNGHLGPGMEVMTKPFVMSAFAGKIRDMIDR